jgi:hypothetical protein
MRWYRFASVRLGPDVPVGAEIALSPSVAAPPPWRRFFSSSIFRVIASVISGVTTLMWLLTS